MKKKAAGSVRGTIFSVLILLSSLSLLVSCSVDSSTEQVPNNSTSNIQGKALYSNSVDNSNIIVALDRTDGLLSSTLTISNNASRSIVATKYCSKDGSYKFSNLETGLYKVYAISSDSSEKAVSKIIAVNKNETVLIPDLTLTATGSLSGKISINESESSKAGIMVFIAGTSFIALTDENGTFTISGIPIGNNYQLIVMYDNCTYIWRKSISVYEFANTYVGEFALTLNEQENNFSLVSIIWKGAFSNSSELENPQYLWAYYNTTDGCSYIYDGTTWCLLASAGTNGKDGINSKITITYELNGGSLTSDAPLIHIYGTETFLSEPVRDGYYFEGFYYEEDFSGESITILDDTYSLGKILYAKWTKYRTLLYISNNKSNSQIEYQFTIPELEKSYVSENLFEPLAGYIFKEWNTTSAGIGTIANTGVLLSDIFGESTEIELYATWEPIQYSITYDTVLDTEINNPNTAKTYTIESNDIELLAPSVLNESYIFKGWTDGNTIITKISNGSINDIHLTALWELATFSVTYENTLDAENKNPTTYTVNDSLTLVPLSKTGYIFKGWSQGSKINKGTTGDKIFTAEWEIITYKINYTYPPLFDNSDNPTEYTVEDNIVIYEKSYGGQTFTWFINEFGETCTGWKTGTKLGDINLVLNTKLGIVYELNKGTNNSKNATTYSVEETVTLYEPFREGFTFEGWYTDSSFSNNSIAGWDAWQQVRNVTLYAKWTWTAIKEIKAMTESGTIIGIGEIGTEEIEALRNALRGLNNSSIMVNLDISNVRGLTAIGSIEYSYNQGAFAECYNLKSITIPNSVKILGGGAFSDCRSLTNIEIPDSVEEIGNFCFEDCHNLEEVIIGNGITKLPDGDLVSPYTVAGIFSGCENLKNIKLSNKLEYIGSACFTGCDNLKIITIPSSVKTIKCISFYLYEHESEPYYFNTATNVAISPFANTSLTEVIFENPKNWYVTQDWLSSDSEKIKVSETDLSEPAKAAELIDTYSEYTWIQEPDTEE